MGLILGTNQSPADGISFLVAYLSCQWLMTQKTLISLINHPRLQVTPLSIKDIYSSLAFTLVITSF